MSVNLYFVLLICKFHISMGSEAKVRCEERDRGIFSVQGCFLVLDEYMALQEIIDLHKLHSRD